MVFSISPAALQADPFSATGACAGAGDDSLVLLKKRHRYCATYVPRNKFDASVPIFNVSTIYHNEYVMKGLCSILYSKICRFILYRRLAEGRMHPFQPTKCTFVNQASTCLAVLGLKYARHIHLYIS